jgi:hypothetical protein
MCLEDGVHQAEKKVERYHAKKMSVQSVPGFFSHIYFVFNLL